MMQFDWIHELKIFPLLYIYLVMKLIVKGINSPIIIIIILDDDERKYVLTNAMQLAEITRGRNVILSSDAQQDLYHRSPSDLVMM